MAALRSRKSSVTGTPISSSSGSRAEKSTNSSNEDIEDSDSDAHDECSDGTTQLTSETSSRRGDNELDSPISPPSKDKTKRRPAAARRHASAKKFCKEPNDDNLPGVPINTKDIDCLTETMSKVRHDLTKTIELLRGPEHGCDTGSGVCVGDKLEASKTETTSTPAATRPTLVSSSFLRDKLNFYGSELKRLDGELDRLTKEENCSLELNAKLSGLYNDFRQNWCDS